MESGAEIKINQPEVKSVEEKIKDRFSQTKPDRLVEYLTGLRLGDPKLLDRLEEDQEIVRAKYGLRNRNFNLSNPSDYESYLRELAQVNGVSIRPTSDCGQVIRENMDDNRSVFIENDSVIGNNIDKSTREEYLGSLINLEHEVIHSLQYKLTPDMPIEVCEYEAYIANWAINYLRKNPTVVEYMFSCGIDRSVNDWYREQSEKFGEIVRPSWDSPEYFLLNVDGVSQEQIDEYKARQVDKGSKDLVISQALDNVRV